MTLDEARKQPVCGHWDAQYGCFNCKERTRALLPEFPLLVDRDYARPGPISIPWSVAEKAWGVYAGKYGTSQSVERLAQRGGFSWSEMDVLYPAWRTETDELRRQKSEMIQQKETLARQLQETEAKLEKTLRALAELVNAGNFQASCTHNAEPHSCDVCAFQREKAVATARREAIAVLRANGRS